ncbi:MAG: NAD(P)/FAD-dependent oxidoreductase [Lactovum sp.]
MKNFDVIVVGAGPSGMMAAIQAAENGAKVALIDKNKRVGKKLLLTGGGRCNVTNSASTDEIIQNIPGNGRFLHSALSQFSNLDIIQFFENNHVKLKEEDHGRLFPVTNQSKTIVDALFTKILALHISYFPESSVIKILKENQKITGLETKSEHFKSEKIILATGGKSYPSTGSNGDGYPLLKNLGHQISPLYATESALISSASFILDKSLQGISLTDILLSVLNSKGKQIISHQHDLLFTHFGLSGPAALRCSSFINQEKEKGQKSVIVSLDQFPHLSQEVLHLKIKKALDSDKSIKNSLSFLSQERMLIFALNTLKIHPKASSKSISNKVINDLVTFFKSFQIPIDKTFPIEKSFVTAGGVKLKEIQPQTMESKLVKGLYIVGELLDINGYTGGYNISAAFVTGAVAGRHASR